MILQPTHHVKIKYRDGDQITIPFGDERIATAFLKRQKNNPQVFTASMMTHGEYEDERNFERIINQA